MPNLLRSLLALVLVLMAGGPLTAQTPITQKVGAPAPQSPPPGTGSTSALLPGGSDFCFSCETIGGLGVFPFNCTGATTGAEGQAEPICDFFGTTAIANDVWFCWTAPFTGILVLTTCGLTTLDTKCAVYPHSTCPPSPALACNDDSCSSLQTTLCLPVTAGTTYNIQLGLYPGTTPGAGAFSLSSGSSCCQSPSIVTQPQSATACNGASTTLSVAATGTGTLSYQWYRNGGAVSGGTSSSLVTNIAGSYFVTITNSCSAITSTTVTVTVANSPWSTVSPVGVAGCPGGLGATLTATANGGGPYTYQWTRNNVPINGATGSSHGTGPLSASTIGIYRVIVTNACGAATSLNSCSVSMYEPVTITLQPVSQSVCAGDSVSFSVAATGQPTITYQWRRNGVLIGGATAPTYSIPTVSAGNAGSYTCTCTNTCGSVTSTTATLTVLAPPTSTISPTGVVGCPGVLGTTLTATVSGGAPYAYQWTLNNTSINGATASTYGTGPLSPSTAGVYRVIVTNACGSATSLNTCVISLIDPVTITLQPTSQSVCVGSGATFSVAATGQATITYQWRRNGIPIGSATSANYSIAAAVAGDAGSYTCVCTNTCGSVVSTAALLTVLESQGITSFCHCDTGNGPCFSTNSTVPGNPAPDSGPGRGCVNSLAGSIGARLEATGSAAVSADSLVLTVTGVPEGPILLYQGTTSSGPAFAFDGLWCHAASPTLLCATTAGSSGGFGANQATYPNGACTSTLSVLGAVPGGATRYYQVRYKDYGEWCTSATANTTNALSIAWCP